MAGIVDDIDRIEKGINVSTILGKDEAFQSQDFRHSNETSVGRRPDPTSNQPGQNMHATSMPGLSSNLLQSILKVLFHSSNKRSEPQVPARGPSIRAIQDCPKGYPRLAAFLDSDENFMLYRRFGFIQARLLLYKQDQMRRLEERLDIMDEIDDRNNSEWLRSRETSDAESGRRKNLMGELEEIFNGYANLLTTARDLASFNRPLARDYASVKRYFDQTAPLVDEEAFIYCQDDTVALRPVRETAWIDQFVEKILVVFYGSHVQYMFSSMNWSKKTDPANTGVLLFNRTRIENVVSIIIMTLILALFTVPIYVLWFLTKGNSSDSRVALVIGLLIFFTLLFCAVLWLTTRAKRHEILAAAAAYCAILVVFLGNVGQITSGNSGSAATNSSSRV